VRASLRYFLLAAGLAFHCGLAAAGTPWDHAPEGGGIRPRQDGNYDVVDKGGKVIKTVTREGKPAGDSPAPAPAAPQKPWGPEDMRGTVWDRVPPGGGLRPRGDGGYDIVDKDGKLVETVPAGGEKNSGEPAVPPADGGKAGAPAPPPALPPVTQTDTLPSGATVTHTQNPDGSWSHHYRREDKDGNVVDYDLKPDDDLYPKGHPVYDPPKPAEPKSSAPTVKPEEPVVTKTPSGGTITSTRQPDGTWKHHYHREKEDGSVLDYDLDADDDLIPKDPRFQPPDPFGDKLGRPKELGFRADDSFGTEMGRLSREEEELAGNQDR